MTITTTDYDNIVGAVRLYIDGFNQGDVEMFKRAFHEDAWMFFTDEDGVLHRAHLEENLFREWASEGKGDNIQLRILSVAQMGDAAAVALTFSDDWMDFHSLVRVNGVWKITNKTACHRSRT